MDQTWANLASIYGAILATILGIIKFWDFYRDRPIIKIDAVMGFVPVTHDDPEYGTRMTDEKGLLQEAYISIVISNHGKRSVQIVSIFVQEQDNRLHQIHSNRLPIILENGCQVVTRIQKEWIDDPNAIALGALDGLGGRHPLSKIQSDNLFSASRSLSTNRQQYVEKANPKAPPVWAWKIRDEATISSKATKMLTIKKNP